MSNETKIIELQNRISKLKGRQRDNGNIIRKLERQIVNLQK